MKRMFGERIARLEAHSQASEMLHGHGLASLLAVARKFRAADIRAVALDPATLRTGLVGLLAEAQQRLAQGSQA